MWVSSDYSRCWLKVPNILSVHVAPLRSANTGGTSHTECKHSRCKSYEVQTLEIRAIHRANTGDKFHRKCTLGCSKRTKRQSSVFCFLPQLILGIDNTNFFFWNFGPVVYYGEKQNIHLQNFVLVKHPSAPSRCNPHWVQRIAKCIS